MDFDFSKPGLVLRERRQQRGLSLVDVANALGVSKSLVSMVEKGERSLADEHVGVLASLLDLPEELLHLATGRLPADVEQHLPHQALLVTRAIRQAAEQYGQRLDEGLPPSLKRRLVSSDVPVKTPAERGFEGRIQAGKNSLTYRVHSYHTKVPPEAIAPIIESYTQPGDVVLDPFCGSGMTGVAALRVGRHAVLSDIAPAAVHIARNYTTPCDPLLLEQALSRVQERVRSTMAFLYDALEPDGMKRTVEHTVWSDVYACPTCKERWTFWEATAQKVGREAGKLTTCPRCNATHRKQDLTWVGEAPVVSTTSKDGGRGRDEHDLTAAELELIEQAKVAPIPFWTPDVPFGREREMWRASHEVMGVRTASDFYSRRNLHALAGLRHAILQEPDERLRDALMFAFTGCVNRASRRYQWNAKRPTNVMSGTLYISSLRYEWNVWSLFRRKAADAIRYYADFPRTDVAAGVVRASATSLAHVPDHAVDFVFMDPPFGSNIFYADSSLLWEAWLGCTTTLTDEIVVNQKVAPEAGGKTVERYGDLIRESFQEVRRVLKPGGRAVLAFSNTDDRVWEAIRGAIEGSGFEIEHTAVLDKVHHSIKGIQGTLGNERVTRLDLLIALRPRTAENSLPASTVAQPAVQDLVVRCLNSDAARPWATDEVYTWVLQALLERGASVQGVNMAVIDQLLSQVGTREPDGRWRRRAEAGHAYRPVDPDRACLADEYLRAGRSFAPQADGCRPLAVEKPLAGAVVGTRNTALYNAHSYHTKVPPEAITPFLEHFTRPGDVVLDPFAGSGMTGVAAAQVGRRCILNDLSVISTHLAFNHTRPCDPEQLKAEFERLYERLLPEFRRLYWTEDADGERGYVHFTLWSKVYMCKSCSHRFSLWAVTDTESGRVSRLLACPACGFEAPRLTWRSVGNEPVAINYERLSDRKRVEREPTPADLDHIKGLTPKGVTKWYPKLAVESGREMYIRSALHLQGIQSVADFYTPRNLQALALLWDAVMGVADERVRFALAFAFTNTAWHGTKMRRFNARGGQRPLTGTLYIPQLSSEVNVLEVMRNKISQLATYYRAYQPVPGVPEPLILHGSATDLGGVPDTSVDYIFTDPPFGSNIFYADCNLIWESWLGGVTDDTLEAVVNRSKKPAAGGKTVQEYQGLMGGALKEMHRVLKPGGWVTLVFHNTDPDVWRALQDAASGAGFRIDGAASLDRQQQSHKGYKGRSGAEDVAHFDVVISMQKVTRQAPTGRQPVTDERLVEVLTTLADGDKRIGTSVQWAHSAVIRHLIAADFDLSDVSYDRVRGVHIGLFGGDHRPKRTIQQALLIP